MRNRGWCAHMQKLEEVGGVWRGSVKSELQELVYTQDMARLRIGAGLILGQVGIGACERVDESWRKGRTKAVRRTFRTSSSVKNSLVV